MKSILILADGIVAKQFLGRINQTYIRGNEYAVVSPDDKILPGDPQVKFVFYHLDPTSFYKLSMVLRHRHYDDVFIFMRNRLDALSAYDNVRSIYPLVRIKLVNRWNIEIKDEHLINIDTNTFVANRVYDFLPNVPVLAQNVGKGQGEIMEVSVPFASAYVYRNIGSIKQQQWRITALYRGDRMILPLPSLIIKPNDTLLLVGKPTVLETIYKAIKQELGQFPAPFGENIYLFFDLKYDRFACMQSCIKQAIYLHRRLKDKRLVIRIYNPVDIECIRYIKTYDAHNIDVVIDYHDSNLQELLLDDVGIHDIGLIVVSNAVFMNRSRRKALHRMKVPVLKLGKYSVSEQKALNVVMSDEKTIEYISATVFDVASQLDMNIQLIDYDPEGEFHSRQMAIAHYENLSSIFSRKLQVKKAQTNPITQLKSEEPFLQVIPFSHKILAHKILALLSTNHEKLFFKLNANPQLFVPVHQ